MYFDPPRGAAVLAALAAGLAPGCSRPTPQPETPAAPAAEQAPAPVAIPAPPPRLGRPELLDAVAVAADAYAAHRPAPADAADITGRTFRLKLPFGCFSPPLGEAGIHYEWNEEARTLKLSAAPEVWTSDPAVRSLVGDEATEALEGFWLRRPWLRTADCPAAPAEPAAGPPSPETVGLVSIFGREDSRLQKRARRPYEITRRLKDDERPSPIGYRLVLEGRIEGDESHPAIACRSSSPEQRPTCFVRISLDRVAFETPAGEQLAEWRS